MKTRKLFVFHKPVKFWFDWFLEMSKALRPVMFVDFPPDNYARFMGRMMIAFIEDATAPKKESQK